MRAMKVFIFKHQTTPALNALALNLTSRKIAALMFAAQLYPIRVSIRNYFHVCNLNDTFLRSTLFKLQYISSGTRVRSLL